MRIKEHNTASLVLEEKPWLESLVGAAFVAGGAWAFVSGERGFGIGFVLAGLVILVVFANIVTNRFDRGTGRWTRSLKGLVRRSVAEHPLDQIKAVDVEASASGNPSRAYRIAIAMRAGARVPLTSGYSSGQHDKEQLAAELRRFLNLQ